MSSQKSPPHTFTYHLPYRLIAWVGVIFFFGLTVVSLLWAEPYTITVAFTLFMVLSLVWVIWSSYSYEVYANGLVMRSILGQEHFLEWRDITAVRGNSFNATIRLVNKSGQTPITIEPMVADYPLLMNYLLQARPDLFLATTNQFSRPGWVLWAGSAAGLLFVGFGLYNFDPENIGATIFLAGLGLAILALLASVPQKLTLQEGGILLEYYWLFQPKIIPVQEIANIYTLMGPWGNGATTVILLTNNKTISLGGFQNAAILTNTLQVWMTKELQKNAPPTAIEKEEPSES